MSSSRPRRSSTRSTKKVSSALYVGYVDDDETPEMIMKKFEMLDKFVEASSKGYLRDPLLPGKQNKQKKNSIPEPPDLPQEIPSTDGPLNEHQLELLFKMTSTFTVPTDGNFDLQFDGFYDKGDFEFSEDEERYFVGEDDFFSKKKPDRSKKRKRDDISKRYEREHTGIGTYKPKIKLLSMELVGEDGMFYTIKKKVKLVDPLEPTYIRIPSQVPLPKSWARSVTPYTGLNYQYLPSGCNYLEVNISTFNFASLGQKFQGILVDPPQLTDPYEQQGKKNRYVEMLYGIRLDLLLDNGLLFIWADSSHIAATISVATRWGFTYAENLVWIKQSVNHAEFDEPNRFFTSCKATLLIFKKGSGFALRHQRHPDVIFDIVRYNKYQSDDKPKYVYTILETLLPEACYREDIQQGQFLEIWARRGSARKGWTSIVQEIPSQSSFGTGEPKSIPLVINN